MLKMHRQKHGVARLQQNQEIPAVGFSCYLMTFSAFGSVGTRVLSQMQRRSINDKYVLGQHIIGLWAYKV